MDRQLDEISDCVKGYCIRTSIAVWTFIQSLIQWCKKSYTAVQQAHQQEIWFFMDHNHAPYMIRNLECFPENYRLIYNPETRAFGLPPNHEGHHRTHRMDVLSAELFCSTTNRRWDISEHLTQVSWKGQYAPSIYEMILCWMLHEKTPPFSHSILKQMKLRIETAEINPTTFTLDNDQISRRYIGF